MAVIQIPDDQAAAVDAKAAAQGLPLEQWFQKLAEDPSPTASLTPAQTAAARIRALGVQSKPDPEGWTVRGYIHRARP